MRVRALTPIAVSLAAVSLALSGCMYIPASVFDEIHESGSMREPTGGPTFAIVNTAGDTIGGVRMWESPGAVTFRIEAHGLPHGVHALHVHSTGRCDAPSFETAGPHWNPGGRQHGIENPAGPHLGDLINVTVAANGVVQQTVPLYGASFATLYDAAGDSSSLIIHAAADDYRTDPSGNSGERIACAVFAAQ